MNGRQHVLQLRRDRRKLRNSVFWSTTRPQMTLSSRLFYLVASLSTASLGLLQQYHINRKTSSMILSDRRIPSIVSGVCLVKDAVPEIPPAVNLGGETLDSFASIGDLMPSRSIESFRTHTAQLLGTNCVNKSASECSLDGYEPLRFNFVGYSVWLEVEEFDQDLSFIVRHYAQRKGIVPIPLPHVTAIYGIIHLSEEIVRERFKEFVTKKRFESWPPLKPVGIYVDVEYLGVNGGQMDMSWAEISFSNSQEHEDQLDMLYDIFYPDESPVTRRSRPWKPHISIAYDNPESTCLNLKDIISDLIQIPTLLHSRQRRVTGISLWSTAGKLTDWKCLERVVF